MNGEEKIKKNQRFNVESVCLSTAINVTTVTVLCIIVLWKVWFTKERD